MTNTTKKVRRLPLPKSPRELHERLEKLKCTVEPARNGHLIVRSPLGGHIQVAKTPSDPANLGNMVTRLKRSGMDVRLMQVTKVADPRA